MHEFSLARAPLKLSNGRRSSAMLSASPPCGWKLARSCVEESAVRFSFEIVCHGTVAQGCDLHIVYKPAQPGAGIAARWWRFISTMRSVRSVTASGCVSIPAIR